MNNKQVAHIWANKSKAGAKGSSFYFEGDTIYSYGPHFPIARHYKGAVLFTSKQYSVTTAKHISVTRFACDHLPVFTVADVLANPSGADVRNYAAKIADCKTTLARAKNPEWPLAMLESAINEANQFCERFGFKTRFEMPGESELSAIKERCKVAAEKKAKQTAARNAKIEADNAVAVQEWIAGTKQSLPYSIGKVYLREKTIVADIGENRIAAPHMETSKGATVPLSDAEKAFRFVMARRETGWRRNGETFAIGDFYLDAVNSAGVVAGCHRIEWAEIERFAGSCNWKA